MLSFQTHKGIGCFNNENYSEAVSIFNACITNENNNISDWNLYLYRGKSYFYLKKYFLAYNDLRCYLFENPKDRELYYFLCRCIFLGLQTDCEKYFRLNIELGLLYFYITTSLFPKSSFCHFMQTFYIIFYEKEFKRKAIFDPYKESVRLITKAINLDDSNALYYYTRGKIYLYDDKVNKALEDLLYSNQIFKSHHIDHIGYLLIAQCYLEKHNYPLFNKYLSMANNCTCDMCNYPNLQEELNFKKFRINEWKKQIFQKNITKW